MTTPSTYPSVLQLANQLSVDEKKKLIFDLKKEIDALKIQIVDFIKNFPTSRFESVWVAGGNVKNMNFKTTCKSEITIESWVTVVSLRKCPNNTLYFKLSSDISEKRTDALDVSLYEASEWILVNRNHLYDVHRDSIHLSKQIVLGEPFDASDEFSKDPLKAAFPTLSRDSKESPDEPPVPVEKSLKQMKICAGCDCQKKK